MTKGQNAQHHAHASNNCRVERPGVSLVAKPRPRFVGIVGLQHRNSRDDQCQHHPKPREIVRDLLGSCLPNCHDCLCALSHSRRRKPQPVMIPDSGQQPHDQKGYDDDRLQPGLQLRAVIDRRGYSEKNHHNHRIKDKLGIRHDPSFGVNRLTINCLYSSKTCQRTCQKPMFYDNILLYHFFLF